MPNQTIKDRLIDEWRMVARGARRQMSAIWALVFKEYKIKLGSSKIGLLWALLEPIVAMMAISAIWIYSGREEIYGVHITLFIGSGFAVFITIRLGINYIPHAILSNEALLNYPQVKPIDTLLARFVQGTWLHAIACILMFVSLWWILGVYPSFPDLLLCVEMLVTAMIMALGLAVPLGVLGTINAGALKFISIISQPLMLVSGVVYSTSDLPQAARNILKFNPIVHVIDGFRHGAFGSPLFPEYEPFYPLLFGLICLGFGYLVYFRYRFRLLQK